MQRHDGAVPDDLDALRRLPGIGPYTARAILAFAFERDVAVVDTNVARVLSRAVANRPLTASRRSASPTRWSPGPGLGAQPGLLDLGALSCTPVRGARLRAATVLSMAPLGRGEPDPARRTAFSSRPQASFRGSDREGRGRLLHAALDAPVAAGALAAAAGWPGDPARARRVADEMVAEGLLESSRGQIRIRAR